MVQIQEKNSFKDKIKMGCIALTGLELATKTRMISNLQLSSYVSRLIVTNVGYHIKL